MTQRADGRKSLQILAKLDKARFATTAASRASRRVGDLEWRPAQVASIARDDQRATWHTGHVHAVLSDGQTVIAGSQTGGVWLINPIVSPSFRDGYRAIPLSDRWDTPGVQSLAYGPDGTQHVFVGCSEADSLFLIELQAVLGAMTVKQSDLRIPLPGRTSVYAIVTIDQPRRIVIGTDAGVFWSDVPVTPTDVDAYAWNAAAEIPPGACISIARGPGTSIASVWSPPTPVGPPAVVTGPPEPDRLFVGDWTDGVLALAPAVVPAVAQTHARYFVLASCATARHRMYTTAMDDDEQIRCVLRSDDGGRNWTAVKVPAKAGDQGPHNRAIGVSPYRPDVVALGWVFGPYLSTDGGASWTVLAGGSGLSLDGFPCHGKASGLHSDIHAVYFPINPLQADHLIVASDGGVVVTRDLGHCFDSDYNRSLAVLQFYGPGPASLTGTLAVSSRFPGLLAGGTQDNGNITLHPDHDAGAVWHTLVSGDGGLTRFIDPLGVLLHVSNNQPHVRMAKWDEAAHVFTSAGTVVPADGDATGLATEAFECVVAPAWKRGSQLLYACAGSTNGDVHGLFADADGAQAQFLRVGNVGKSITAVASSTGAQILIARSDGAIIALDTMTGLRSEQRLGDGVPANGYVSRIEVLSSSNAYALKQGVLLRFDGQAWTALPAPQEWIIFTVEQGTGRLFAATLDDVFSSVDGGLTWTDASIGLPASPHITDLRIGADEAGGNTLYLTTYGRSAWRATITLPPDTSNPFKLPPHQRAILQRIIEEGGGLVRLGDDFTPLGARPLTRDVLAALAIDQIAQKMSHEAGREMRRTALRQVQRAIGRELKSIK